jgi:hypothetical protein
MSAQREQDWVKRNWQFKLLMLWMVGCFGLYLVPDRTVQAQKPAEQPTIGGRPDCGEDKRGHWVVLRKDIPTTVPCPYPEPQHIKLGPIRDHFVINGTDVSNGLNWWIEQHCVAVVPWANVNKVEVEKDQELKLRCRPDAKLD